MNEPRIGVISDTHGLLRPEAIEALTGSSLILHAGDIGSPEVLETLRQIAPVIAIRGNIDKEPWCQSLLPTETVELERNTIYMIHDLSGLDLNPSAAGFSAVIFGHSHKPSLERRKGVIFLNPGSAGPKRFHLPISVAVMAIRGNTLEPQLVELKIKP